MKFIFPIAVSAVCMLTACSKNNDDKVTPEGPGAGVNVKTGVYVISNLVADTSATSAVGAATIYYSLEQNRVVPASQAQTNNWDIAFTNIYNSSIAPNNGKASNSPGFGGPGQGALYLVRTKAVEDQFLDEAANKPKQVPISPTLFDASFSDVKTVAIADADFITNDYVGMDHFMGSGYGFAFYDFYGNLFPGNAKKAHIVYPFPRTMIVKTAKGKYAKLQIISMYKDSPQDPSRDNKTGYLSFRFAIQMDGSKNLDLAK